MAAGWPDAEVINYMNCYYNYSVEEVQAMIAEIKRHPDPVKWRRKAQA